MKPRFHGLVAVVVCLAIAAPGLAQKKAPTPLTELTLEEATRPAEQWTRAQIEEKGWTPYDCFGKPGPPFAVEGRRWPMNDGAGNSGTCVTYSFMADGLALEAGPPPEGPSAWFTAMPAGSSGAVTSATATWAAAADIHFTLVTDGGGAFNAGGSAGLKGNLRIASGNIATPGVLAHGYYPPPNGVSQAGDGHFDHGWPWVTSGPAPGPPYDVETVALHELGHELGLTHAGTVAGDVMFPSYTGVKTALAAGDIAFMTAIYGPAGHAAQCTGACCNGPKACADLTAAACAAAPGGWTFRGVGTKCPTQNTSTANHAGITVVHWTDPAINCLTSPLSPLSACRDAVDAAGTGTGSSSLDEGAATCEEQPLGGPCNCCDPPPPGSCNLSGQPCATDQDCAPGGCDGGAAGLPCFFDEECQEFDPLSTCSSPPPEGCGGGPDAGCDCPGCEVTVCSIDPFCCDVLWDGVCVSLASGNCSCCPGQDPGVCDATSAGCNDDFNIDSWMTSEEPDQQTCHQFGGHPTSPPIPPGFFEPGSEPFFGDVCMFGEPVGPTPFGSYDLADTLILRSDDPFDRCELPSDDQRTVDIEIVALNLRSIQPIEVIVAGQPTQWDVHVDLSQIPAPPAPLTATKTHCNGGTYDSVLLVQPRFTFTKLGGPGVPPGTIQILDTGLEGLPPVQLFQEDNPPWSNDLDPWLNLASGGPLCTGFHPGVVDPETTTSCDCNNTGTRDLCDIESGLSSDCNSNNIPDECEPDGDGDGLPDDCDNCPDHPDVSNECVLTPGDVPQILVDKTGVPGECDVQWTAACSSADNSIVWGSLGSVSTYGYSGRTCSIGTTGSHSPFNPGPGSFFFIVVANDGLTTEGSYGKASNGVERPADPVCGKAQLLSLRCD